MEFFVGLLTIMLLAGVLLHVTKTELTGERKLLKDNFDLGIVDPGEKIGEGVFFGEAPFRYARLAFKKLQFAYFYLDVASQKETIVFPNSIREFLAPHIESIDHKNPIWQPTGQEKIDQLVAVGLFLWIKGNAALAIFPPTTKKLNSKEALARVAELKGIAIDIGNIEYMA